MLVGIIILSVGAAIGPAAAFNPVKHGEQTATRDQQNPGAGPEISPTLPGAPAKPSPDPPPAAANIEAIQKEAKKDAYKQTLEQMLPLSPWQIRHFMERRQKTLEAVRSNTKPADSFTGTMQLRLEPGAPINTLYLSPGFVTSVSFFDATGEPWPINTVTVGNPNWFHLGTDLLASNSHNNILTVQALTAYAASNLVITLHNWHVPITINIFSDDYLEKGSKKQGMSNTNVIMRANRRGPMAATPIVGAAVASEVTAPLMDLLDGIPPKEAKIIHEVSEVPGYTLWRYDGSLFFRTFHPVIWPAWDQIIHGAAGVMLYRLPEVVSIIVSEGGKKRHFYF